MVFFLTDSPTNTSWVFESSRQSWHQPDLAETLRVRVQDCLHVKCWLQVPVSTCASNQLTIILGFLQPLLRFSKSLECLTELRKEFICYYQKGYNSEKPWGEEMLIGQGGILFGHATLLAPQCVNWIPLLRGFMEISFRRHDWLHH